MPGVFEDLHKLEWLWVHTTFMLLVFSSVLFKKMCIKLSSVDELFWFKAQKTRLKWCSFCCCRILENNNVHQISAKTFSGLNSLVLLWVSAFIFMFLLFYNLLSLFKTEIKSAHADYPWILKAACCFCLSPWRAGFCWTTLWQSWMTSVKKCPDWTGCE